MVRIGLVVPIPAWMVALRRKDRAESSARPQEQVARLSVWDVAGMNSCFFFAQPRALHGGLAGVNARRRRIARYHHSCDLVGGGELRRDHIRSRLVGELCAGAATGVRGHASVYEPQ